MGCQQSLGYNTIKPLNERMLAINPNFIVLSGRANRKFDEYLHQIDEKCYGMLDRLVKQMMEKQGETEQVKEENQML